MNCVSLHNNTNPPSFVDCSPALFSGLVFSSKYLITLIFGIILYGSAYIQYHTLSYSIHLFNFDGVHFSLYSFLAFLLLYFGTIRTMQAVVAGNTNNSTKEKKYHWGTPKYNIWKESWNEYRERAKRKKKLEVLNKVESRIYKYLLAYQ